MANVFDEISSESKNKISGGSMTPPEFANTGQSVLARKQGFDDSAYSQISKDLALAGRAAAPYLAAAGVGAGAGLFGGPTSPITVPTGAAMGLASKGIYDLGTMVANGLGALFGSPDLVSSHDASVDALLDYAGVPRPKTEGEKIASSAIRGGLGAFSGGPALGKSLGMASDLGPVLTGVSRAIQESPKLQIAQGAAQGATAEMLPDSLKNNHSVLAETSKVLIPMSAAATVGVGSKMGSWALGKTPMTPEMEAALKDALSKRSGSEALTPRQIENYVSAASTNSPVSAFFDAMLRGENPSRAMSDRLGFHGAKKQFDNVRIPEGYDTAIENIQKAQDSSVNGIPDLAITSTEASKSPGIGAFSHMAMATPEGRQIQLNNLRSIAKFRNEQVDPNVKGEYANAAKSEAEGIVKPFQDSFDSSLSAIKEHSNLIDELRLREEASKSIDAQRAAAAKEEAMALSEQLKLQQDALDLQRQQYLAQRPELEQQKASERARSVVDKNRDESSKKYREILSKVQGNQEIGTDKLPEAIAAAVERTQNTLGGKLEPETTRILKDLEQYGVLPPEAPTPGSSKITKTLMPTETGAADYSGASVANFEAQTKGLKPAASGRVRALAEGESPIETVKTPGGSKPYEVQREVVELSDLIHSMGSKNYPKDLQNLNRDSAAAANQKNVITGNFDPEQLTGRQPTGNTGAPIVGPDNVVEGGNMRTAVLSDVLTKPEYAAQREAYIKRLQSMGYDVSGMKNPVEVMRRKTELTPAERLKFAEELNAKTGAERGLTETANRDAMKLDAALMDLWEKGGIGNENNAEFIRRFAQRTMTPNEFATYFPEGKATNALGDRLDAAFLQRAYNNTKLTDTLMMSPDQRIKSIGRAMQDAAPDMARLRAKIESGEIPATHDIPTALTEAAQFIEDARARGRDPLAELKQADAFAKPHPMRDALVEMMFNEAGRQVGGARLGEALSDMAQQAAKSADMFGEKMSPKDMLARGKSLLAKPADGEAPVPSTPSAEPPSMAKITDAKSGALPFDAYGVPSKVFRGTEAGDAVSTLREHPDGELGKGYYVTSRRWLAETYGGGPKADVRDGTRVVHKYEFTRPLGAKDVAYLEGGSTGEQDAVLRSGEGVEIWRGKISAKKTEKPNREAMTEAAQKAGIKVIVGNPDSVAVNQIAVLDKSLLKTSQLSEAETQLAKLESSGKGRSEQAKGLRKTIEAESKAALAAPQTSSSMAKVTEEPAATTPASGEPPKPPETGAVTLEEKPAPRPLTLETATNTIEDLNATISALKRSSEPGSVRAVKQLEAIRDGLKAQVDSVPEGSPVKDAARYWATEHAPLYRHGNARKLSEAGMGGAADKLQAEITIPEFMSQGNTAGEAAQFAGMGKGNPDFVQSVRDYMVGRMAAELKDNFKAGDVQKWLDKNSQLLEPEDFRGIRSEIENYRDSLSAGEGHYTKFESDLKDAMARSRQGASETTAGISESLKSLKADRDAASGQLKEAKVSLRDAELEAKSLPSVKISGGKSSSIDEVLKDPSLARRALATAKTPAEKADLENILKEHFNRRYTTASEISNVPVSDEVLTENLMTSLGKLVQDLKDPNFKESIKILRGEEHLKRLEMIRSAIANEQSRGGMMQGSNVGSATEPKTTAGIAAEAISQTPVGQAGRIARVLKRLVFGNESASILETQKAVGDIAFNPELSKQLLIARRDLAAGKKLDDIKPITKIAARIIPQTVPAQKVYKEAEERKKQKTP